MRNASALLAVVAAQAASVALGSGLIALAWVLVPFFVSARRSAIEDNCETWYRRNFELALGTSFLMGVLGQCLVLGGVIGALFWH
jgi:hypothetical protein